MTVQKKGVADPSRVVDSENAEIILTPREGGEPTVEAQGWMGTKGRWLEGRGGEGGQVHYLYENW